jgi:hypothetical protein
MPAIIPVLPVATAPVAPMPVAEDVALVGADVRRRFGNGLTRRRAGNSGTSKRGEGERYASGSALISYAMILPLLPSFELLQIKTILLYTCFQRYNVLE